MALCVLCFAFILICRFFIHLVVFGDMRQGLQAPPDMVSVWRGAFGRPLLRFLQTRVSTGLPAARMCVLAGGILGAGEYKYFLL